MFEGFFDWGTLGTLVGATAAVTLITQFLNWLTGDKVKGWGMRAISFGVALLVLYAAAFFTGTLDAPTAAITALNAVVVTLAANGLYDNVTSITSK